MYGTFVRQISISNENVMHYTIKISITIQNGKLLLSIRHQMSSYITKVLLYMQDELFVTCCYICVIYTSFCTNIIFPIISKQ